MISFPPVKWAYGSFAAAWVTCGCIQQSGSERMNTQRKSGRCTSDFQ